MIYLDNASTTKIDEEVLKAMLPYLKENYGNAGTTYKLGRKSATAIQKAREQVAQMINAQPEQIIFTSGGSEANNLALQGVVNYIRNNNCIISSEIEHDSILKIIECLNDDNVKLKLIKPTRQIQGMAINPRDVIETIKETPNVGLVSIMQTNNETGITNDVAPIGLYCREHGILFHVDGVQSVGCLKIDVEELKCDMLSISSHKIHGPKGVGALYVRDKSILSSIIHGGHNQEFGLRGGTENVAGIVGFGVACNMITTRQHKQANGEDCVTTILRNELYKEIRKTLPDNVNMRINGDMDFSRNQGKTINICFKGIDAETLVMMLDRLGICVSTGSACRSLEHVVSRTLLAIGVDEEDVRCSVRFSVSKHTTPEEIKNTAKRVAEAIDLIKNIQD